MLETYNKEKLHEYAKELFALCLEKGLGYDYCSHFNKISIFFGNKEQSYYTFIRCYEVRDYYQDRFLEIEKLIEKVKQL